MVLPEAKAWGRGALGRAIYTVHIDANELYFFRALRHLIKLDWKMRRLGNSRRSLLRWTQPLRHRERERSINSLPFLDFLFFVQARWAEEDEKLKLMLEQQDYSTEIRWQASPAKLYTLKCWNYVRLIRSWILFGAIVLILFHYIPRSRQLAGQFIIYACISILILYNK